MRIIALFSVIFSVVVISNFIASYSLASSNAVPPAELSDLMSIEPNEKIESKVKQAPSIRREALKNAALSFGARGGLARRSYEIRRELEHKEIYLDRTYNFNQLLIRGPSGVLIEPPIIAEGQDALIIENDGQNAAVAELILNINKKAKIVSTGRNWRNYLERDWGEVSPPPDQLLPRNDEEREIWRENVKKGWIEGYKQGDEIFQADLDRLSADFGGMVRYRMLLKQNMVSAPFALLEDRGVTGGGNEMRIGDRAVAITGPSQLKARPEEWQPANR